MVRRHGRPADARLDRGHPCGDGDHAPAAALVVPGTLAARGRRSAAAAADSAAGSVADDRSPRAAWPPAGRSCHALRGQPAAAPGTIRTGRERPRRLCRARRDLDRRPGHGRPQEDRVAWPAATRPPDFLGTGRASRSCGRIEGGELLAITQCGRQRTWSSRRERRLSGPTPTRSPGHRTVAHVAVVAAAAARFCGEDDLPRRHDYWRGPGPRHSGGRNRRSTGARPTGVNCSTCDGRGGPTGTCSWSSKGDPSGKSILDRAAVGNENELDIRPGGWTTDGKCFVVHRYDRRRCRAVNGPTLLDPRDRSSTPTLEIAYGRVSNDGKLASLGTA